MALSLLTNDEDQIHLWGQIEARIWAGESMVVANSEDHEKLATALLGIASVRYAAFCKRFGRDPGPHEPLLFDPERDEPTAANHCDRTLQILAAATALNVDATEVLEFLGLRHDH